MSLDTTGLPGRVVRPGDAEYEAARTSWNVRVTRHPAAVVYAASAEDVVAAVAWCRRTGTPFRARSGGHGLEGESSLDDGVVIDVSGLKAVRVDAAQAIAVVGAGVTQAEAVRALGDRGFAAPTGNEGSVGLVGATLGGGLGLLTRSFGMASDNLLGVEIVCACADGGAEVVEVDAASHPDLLWALRGAGNGTFGVVTALTYRVHPLPRATLVSARWAGLAALPEVFAAWQDSAPAVDPRLTSQLEIDRAGITLRGVFAGDAEEEAAALLHPITSIGAPDLSCEADAWADIYERLQVPLDDEPANWKFASQFVTTPFPAEAIAVIGNFLSRAPTVECNYFVNAFGGALPSAEPAGGSVFAHRSALFYAEPGAGWGSRGEAAAASDPLTPLCLAWVADFAQALAPFVNGAYVNVANPGMPDEARAYWGDNVERLRAVKGVYDRDGVFCAPTLR